MTYDAPRQKQDGTWGYTSMNDGSIWAIGYCKPFDEWCENSINAVFNGDKEEYEQYITPYRLAKDKFHDGGHLTAEEACECYKNYVLDFNLRYYDDEENARQPYKCEYPKCKSYTSGGIRIIESIQNFDLCQEHRNKNCISELLKIGSSCHS